MVNAEEKVREMLNKIATERNYENYEIVISRLTTGGANYTSKLFTAVIRAPKKDDIHLFAKVAAMGNAFRNDLPIDLYKNEVFAYTKLAKIYASLEEQNGVPEEHRLKFTKLYGYDLTTFQETLVLENLMEQGYGPHNRFKSVDWDYASAVVESLAKMHALSLAFSKQQEKEYEDSLEALQNQWKENSSMTAMFKKAANSAFEKVNPEYKQRLQKFLGDLKNPFVDMCKSTRCTVITHGDFNGNNLLHKKREDGKVDIKIVDLQTLQGGSPVTDLIYFIFTGSDEEFRAKYYEKLVEHYYTELSAAMKRLHLDPEETFSREDFKHELKEKLPFGLTLAVFALPVVTVDSENAPQVNENLELSNFSVEKTSDLYAERLNGVVNDYVKWGIL